jgi:hypothetical protein
MSPQQAKSIEPYSFFTNLAGISDNNLVNSGQNGRGPKKIAGHGGAPARCVLQQAKRKESL